MERVVYLPEASADVATAYAWYEERAPGLGEDFLRCVEAAVLTAGEPPMTQISADDSLTG